MKIETRIKTWNKLAIHIQEYIDQKLDDNMLEQWNEIINKASYQNPWFTIDSINFALKEWANLLTLEQINTLTNSYTFIEDKEPKNIALILAGNIPMVGFHDIFCTLLTGNKAIIKLSSQDAVLIPFLLEQLINIDNRWKEYIVYADEKLTNYDAVIATGSNNTARYFEYYFSKYPSIIRKNRTSVAVLSGNETLDELTLLGRDIFQYFGLGCRNITKLYVPQGYIFDTLFEAMYPFKNVINATKYANNYEYYKAIYLLNQEIFLDNNFIMIKESDKLKGPVGTLYFEYYTDIQSVEHHLQQKEEELQCIVGAQLTSLSSIAFGETQKPTLNQFADNIDSIRFLLAL